MTLSIISKLGWLQDVFGGFTIVLGAFWEHCERLKATQVRHGHIQIRDTATHDDDRDVFVICELGTPESSPESLGCFAGSK